MTKLEKLCKKLPKYGELSLLADWFDVDDKEKGRKNNEVQRALRKWDKIISKIHEEIKNNG